jgi:hypothetical protein
MLFPFKLKIFNNLTVKEGCDPILFFDFATMKFKVDHTLTGSPSSWKKYRY